MGRVCIHMMHGIVITTCVDRSDNGGNKLHLPQIMMEMVSRIVACVLDSHDNDCDSINYTSRQ